MAFWRPGAAGPASSLAQADYEKGDDFAPALTYGGKQRSGAVDIQRRTLPIFEYRSALLYSVESHGCTVVVGETGCGKSTQIPQYLAEAGWAASGFMIACTQPRRLAATMLAARVAEEMGVRLGEEVGYCIRFEDCSSPARTRIKYMTDGMLLRELQQDPLLSRYSVVMVDEAHERSLQTDVLLGVLKKVRRARPELRLIVSSATLEAERFRDFFDERRSVAPPRGRRKGEEEEGEGSDGGEEGPLVVELPMRTAGDEGRSAGDADGALGRGGNAGSKRQRGERESGGGRLLASSSDVHHFAAEAPAADAGLSAGARGKQQQARALGESASARSSLVGAGIMAPCLPSAGEPCCAGGRSTLLAPGDGRDEHSGRQPIHSYSSNSGGEPIVSSQPSGEPPSSASAAPVAVAAAAPPPHPLGDSAAAAAPPRVRPSRWGAPVVVQQPTPRTTGGGGGRGVAAQLMTPAQAAAAAVRLVAAAVYGAPAAHFPGNRSGMPPPPLPPPPVPPAAKATAPAPQLDAACILAVEGRTFPVDIQYLDSPCSDYVVAAAETALALVTHPGTGAGVGEGDVLIFLPGAEEVERCCDLLREHYPEAASTASAPSSGSFSLPPLEVFPLYAALPADAQAAATEPARIGKDGRSAPRVIVATNIAETSLTLPGVVAVVDSGYVKMPAYDAITGADALLTVPISRAAAAQRAGRAGRVRTGKCFRLYTEAAFLTSLRARTPPEICRSEVTPLVLALLALSVPSLAAFPLLDAPAPEAMMRALELLAALGAVAAPPPGGGRRPPGPVRLTRPVGQAIADLPVEPRVAAMLLAALGSGCAELALTVAAMTSVSHLFTGWRPGASRQLALATDLAARGFAVREGDALTLVNVYRAYEVAGRSAEWAHAHCLNPAALARAAQVRSQLRAALAALCSRQEEAQRGVQGGEDGAQGSAPAVQWSLTSRAVGEEDETVALRKAIAAGFFSNAARLDRDGEHYVTVKEGHRGALHPASVLSHMRGAALPQWIVFGEAVWTSQLFLRDVTAINPTWLLAIAPHMYSDPGRAAMPQHYLQEVRSGGSAGGGGTVSPPAPAPPPAILLYKSAAERRAEREAAAAAAAAATASVAAASAPAPAPAAAKPTPSGPGLAGILGSIFGEEAAAQQQVRSAPPGPPPVPRTQPPPGARGAAPKPADHLRDLFDF